MATVDSVIGTHTDVALSQTGAAKGVALKVPTPEEIIAAYSTNFPTVVQLAEAELITPARDRMKAYYDELSITAADKAKLMTQFEISTIATVVNTSQSTALQLAAGQYKVPTEVAYQAVQTELLGLSLEQNVAIKAFTEVASMVGSLGAGGLVAPTPLIYMGAKALEQVLASLGPMSLPTLQWESQDGDTSVAMKGVKDFNIG